MEDTTIEGAQEVLRDSPDGVLCLQDELSGWFGSMDKYAAGRGAAKDRGFWLQAFNGGQYAVNRISRGSFLIPNLSASVLGGIQPDPLRPIPRADLKKQESRWACRRSGSSHVSVGLTGLLNPT